MKREVINPEGNWSYWTEAQKEELKKGLDTRTVGDKIVFENEKFRIWTIHLPPGERLPFHKHSMPYFWAALNAGVSRSYFHDGSVMEIYYEAGSVKNFPDLSDTNYFIHDLTNIGNTMLVFTTVEFFS